MRTLTSMTKYGCVMANHTRLPQEKKMTDMPLPPFIEDPDKRFLVPTGNRSTTKRYSNFNGELVCGISPREVPQEVEAIRIAVEKVCDEIIANSYPVADLRMRRLFAHILQSMAKVVRNSEYDIVLWEPPIWETACNGADSFMGQDLKPDDLPVRPTFWWHGVGRRFEQCPLTFHERMWWTPDWEIHGMYLCPLEKFVPSLRPGDPLEKALASTKGVGMITFWYKAVDKKVIDTVPRVEYLPRVVIEPGIQYDTLVNGVYATMAAAHNFLKLPFVDVSRHSLNHAERKPYKREGRTPPQVQCIVLRRSASAESEPSEQEGARHFDCHFLVSGHWRQGKRIRTPEGTYEVGPDGEPKRRKPEWVSPYIKGDTSKPLHIPKQTVYVAKR